MKKSMQKIPLSVYWEWNLLLNEDSKATLQIHESSLLFNVCKRRSNTLVFIRSHRSQLRNVHEVLFSLLLMFFWMGGGSEGERISWKISYLKFGYKWASNCMMMWATCVVYHFEKNHHQPAAVMNKVKHMRRVRVLSKQACIITRNSWRQAWLW